MEMIYKEPGTASFISHSTRIEKEQTQSELYMKQLLLKKENVDSIRRMHIYGCNFEISSMSRHESDNMNALEKPTNQSFQRLQMKIN